MVAELVLGHQTPNMRLRTSSGGLGYSSYLFGPRWVPNSGHLGVRVSSGHTHHTEGGVLHREGDRDDVGPKAFFVRSFVL